MLRRIALIALIAGAFSGAMYTTVGCGGTSPTGPTSFGDVRGTVTNAQGGAPLAGVSVSATSGSSVLSLLTDSSGVYDLVAPVGSARITASKSGFQTFNMTITVQTGINTLDIRLEPQ